MKGLCKLKRSTHKQLKHRRASGPGRSLRFEVLDKRLLLAADLLEPNNSIAEVDSRPAGEVNSPNFAAITENLNVSQLNLEDEVDWYRFETDDWGTSHDFVEIQFADNDGDLQLELYDSDGITRLRQFDQLQ